MKRAVITGIGVVSPFGLGYDLFKEGLMNEKSKISTIKHFDTSGMKCNYAGTVPYFDINEYITDKGETKRISRVAVLSIIAAGEAIKNSGIDIENNPEDISVIIGSGAGGIDFGELQYERYFNNEMYKVSPFAIPSSVVGMASSEISIFYHLYGMSHTVSNGCTSGIDAIGYSLDKIRLGRSKIIITGGSDACVIKGIMSGFERMGVLSNHFRENPEEASRPFDKDRDGFVLGEGSFLFVLEELESAKKRGADIICELKGYGATCEAYHRVALANDGKQSAKAVALALQDASISPDDIDYVNLHGTSTDLNDITETNSMKLVFKDNAYKVPMSATKSYIGHPQGGSAALGLAAAITALKTKYIHPTLNLVKPDPVCDLNYIPNKGIEKKVKNAVINCLGFGSKNSSIVISDAEI